MEISSGNNPKEDFGGIARLAEIIKHMDLGCTFAMSLMTSICKAFPCGSGKPGCPQASTGM